MTERELNFSEDIITDKYRLDWELVNGPQIHNDWGKVESQAKKEQQKAKAKIDLVNAELDEDIRTNWEDYNFDKRPTEAAIKQAIIKSDRYQKAMEDFIEANSNVNYLGHCMDEFDQKHDNLGRLIKLFLTGYYSESTAIREDIVEKKLDDKTRKKIQKKLATKEKKKKLKKGK